MNYIPLLSVRLYKLTFIHLSRYCLNNIEYAVLFCILSVANSLHGLLFISAALFGHFASHGMMTQNAKMKDVPIAGVAVIVTGLRILLGGVIVLLGYKTKIGAILLVLLPIPAALILHNS